MIFVFLSGVFVGLIAKQALETIFKEGFKAGRKIEKKGGENKK